jgi:hypothetical protein
MGLIAEQAILRLSKRIGHHQLLRSMVSESVSEGLASDIHAGRARTVAQTISGRLVFNIQFKDYTMAWIFPSSSWATLRVPDHHPVVEVDRQIGHNKLSYDRKVDPKGFYP